MIASGRSLVFAISAKTSPHYWKSRGRIAPLLPILSYPRLRDSPCAMIASMRTDHTQPGILAPPPSVGRSVRVRSVPDSDLRRGVAALRAGFEIDWGVVGFAKSVSDSLSARLDTRVYSPLCVLLAALACALAWGG